MQTTTLNTEFLTAVQYLRGILPRMAFGLLIITYLISAIIMGLFHAQGAENTGFIIAAFAVPLVIQAGRGTLVFFFQLNPAKIHNKTSFGIIAATVLLILSLAEAGAVMWTHGLSWTISVATLMIIGWIIEIMILKETQYASEMEFYANPDTIDHVKKVYLARRDFEQFLKDLDHQNASAHNEIEIDQAPKPAAAPGK